MSRISKRILAITLLAVALLSAGLSLVGQQRRSRDPGFRTRPTAQPVTPATNASYVVDMSPMGPVSFAHPPQRVVTQDANYNDMLVALGQEEKLVATAYSNNLFNGFYQQLPGTSRGIDRQRATILAGASGSLFDKETLYALHADVHHIDPLQLAASRGWSRADVEEIARNVGPFFANRFSRDNNYSGPEPYAYYSIWELSSKVGEVYCRASRIARLKEIHDRLLRTIESRLPPADQRPAVALVFYANGRFTPYRIGTAGFGQAHYRAVGAHDAFDGTKVVAYGDPGGRNATIDLEGLLAIDPAVLIMPFAIYPASGSGTSRANYDQLMTLASDPLGQRLSAFRNHRVYPGGTPLQGPLFFLFQIEMAAKQIYPVLFGPYRDDQSYPPSEQLFDRAAVAAVLKDESGMSGAGDQSSVTSDRSLL